MVKKLKSPFMLLVNSPILKHARFSKINLAVFILIFAGIGGYILLSSHAAGFTANVFVSPNGSDSGANCQRFASAVNNPDSGGASLCATFQKAYAIAQPGDTVEVENGTYASQTILRGSQSQAGPAITFKAASVHGAVLSSPGSKALTLGSLAYSSDANLGPSNLTFDGIDINGETAFQSQGTNFPNSGPTMDNLTITNSHIWDMQAHDIFGSCGHIQNCTLSHDEVGPACCKVWGWGAAENSSNINYTGKNIVYDHVYMHDLYDSCNNVPAAIKTQYGCAAVGYGDISTSTTLASSLDTSATKVGLTNGSLFPPAGTNYYIRVDSEIMRVIGGQGTNTLTVTRNSTAGDGNCPASGGLVSHSSGTAVSVQNCGYYHPDGIHMGGANGLTITHSTFYRASGSGCGGTIFLEGAGWGGSGGFTNINLNNNFFADPNGICNTMVSIGAPAGNTNLFSGYVKLLYNTCYTKSICYSTTNMANGGVGNALTPGTTIYQVGNIADGAGGGMPRCSALDSSGNPATVIESHNQNAPGFATCGNPGDISGTPSFVNTAENTVDLHLSGAQPAIDGGESAYCSSTDIDDDVRPQGAVCDIGADEYVQPPSTVNIWVSTSGNDTTCTRGDQTKPCLSFAKACSIAQGGDIVQVADGTYPAQDVSACTGKTSLVTFQPVSGHECPYSAATPQASLPAQNSDTSCAVTINGQLNMYNQSYPTMTTASSIVNSSLKNLKFTEMYAKTINIGFVHGVTLDHMAAAFFYVSASDSVTIQNSDFGNTFNGDCSVVSNRANTPTPYPDSSNVTIKGNIFHDSVRLTSAQSHPDGLFIQGLNGGVVDSNVFYRDAVLPLYLNSVAGGSIQNISITNNVIHDVVDMTDTGSSTQSQPQGSLSPQGISLGDNTMSNVTVAFNSVSGYIRRQDNSPGGSGSGPTANLKVYGNTAMGMVWQSGTWGCGDNASYDYNVWFGTSAAACGAHDSAPGTGSSPFTTTDTWTSAGSYFTVLPGNYTLAGASKPVDYIPASFCTSNPGICPSADYAGITRPQNGSYDAGALERTGPSAKPGDINGDGKVTLADLAILLTHYGQTANASQGDLNGDGKVTLADLAILLTNYGR